MQPERLFNFTAKDAVLLLMLLMLAQGNMVVLHEYVTYCTYTFGIASQFQIEIVAHSIAACSHQDTRASSGQFPSHERCDCDPLAGLAGPPRRERQYVIREQASRRGREAAETSDIVPQRLVHEHNENDTL